ncbi:MAG: LysM peptidoglycan-binding domain-containing protein [Chloroflexi bacterium]|nr:MAG: LysM peptidoglycan-binding domain-containing protein [Chloroflexota bacterium]
MLALLLLDVAWLLWAWTIGSLCLELLVVVADAAAHGAAWVGSVRQLADRLSVPVVRRAVAAAFAVQVLSRGVTVAAAQPVSPAETALVEPAYSESTAARSAPAPASPEGPTYLVRPGDTLWSIAERAYGSGMHYRRLIDANVGRRMPDGRVFSAQGVIQPGWELAVPDAMPEVEEVDGERWYTVQPGDTLSAIAARLLGDQARWSDLFDLNHGATSPDGSHLLVDADVIWPGLRLCLPGDPTAVPGTDPADAVAMPADAGQPAGSPGADLVAASAIAPSAAPAVEMTPAQVPLDSPGEVDSPPLLRTPHALDPVLLEPADTGGPPDPSPPMGGDVSLRANAWRDELPLTPIALGGLGIAAVAGVAIGATRMRRLRPLPQEPESEVVVEGGFAEAQLAQDFTRGVHGVGFDPVAALVRQVENFLHEYNLSNPGVVAVRHGRSATTITLKASLAEQPILVDLAPVLAERLQADASAWVSADQDVVVRLARLRRTRLLPTADALVDSPCLVPLGVLYDRQVYSAAWSSLGHVLVASLPGHGADTILTSLVATLTARRSPEELRVWIIGSSRSLPAPVFDLPHLERVVDPTDPSALQQAADDLRAEVDQRAAHQRSADDLGEEVDRSAVLDGVAGDPGDEIDEINGRDARQARADLVLVVPELTVLGELAPAFELLVNREADLGLRLVAATASPEEALASPLLAHFGTRMVLRMQDEEASVALLGVADAAFLGGGGRLLLRLDGREPVELYGYQVPTEHLERLVRVMRSAYPSGSPPVAATVSTPAEQRATTRGATEAGHVASAAREAEVAAVDGSTRADHDPAALASGQPEQREAPDTRKAEPAAAHDGAQAEDLAALMAIQAELGVAASGWHAEHGAATGVAEVAGALSAVATEALDEAPQSTDAAAAATNAETERQTEKQTEGQTQNQTEGQAQSETQAGAAPRPPIEVICFGGPRVSCGGVQVWPRLPGGEAKPWELLLYLACQPAEGVSSQDAVEALWPEDDSAVDPPHRFRQLRYRLRRALSELPGAPEAEGICFDRGVLRLDPAVVYSDAQEFLSLARSARITPGVAATDFLERARALYAGDLLQGPDAKRYAWVDERDPSGVTLREHFRRLYQQGCVRLAEVYTGNRELDAATDLYRELTEIDPGDERLWLALFRLHVDRGDRLALVRDEHRMRASLHELASEVDRQPGAQADDPSRETSREYERMLASLHDREREPATA